METVTTAAITLVALIHLYIMVLEMFFWDKPAGLRTFGLTPEKAGATRVLAANQGLYNGFLAAGLLLGLALGAAGKVLMVFMLCCVLIAGVYGAASTARWKILFVQSVPAAVALALLCLAAT